MNLLRILLDTNILLRNALPDDPLHEQVRSAILHLLSAGWELCITTQNLTEYWVVATRPRSVNGMGRTVAQTEQDVLTFMQTLTLLSEPLDIAERWLTLCARYGVQGLPAHDARIAAVMEAHGVGHILTLNPGDFQRYEGIVCHTPADLP